MIEFNVSKIEKEYQKLKNLVETGDTSDLEIENLQILRALAVFERIKKYAPKIENLEEQARFAVAAQNKTWDFFLSFFEDDVVKDFRKVRSQRYDPEMKKKYREYKKVMARVAKPFLNKFFEDKKDPIDKKAFNIVKELIGIK